jgi:hypothetical protein
LEKEFNNLTSATADGRILAIEVCNHSAKHLENLIERTDVVPMVNQVEVHPFFMQREVREADARHGVVTQAWSPLGGVYRYAPADPNAVKDSQKAGRITAAGMTKEVTFEPVDRPINERIDDAYRAKYRGSPYFSPMIGARARSATVKVMPRETNA